ncbi:MAG: hypothetical protein QNJ16_12940 [Rhodobacter sp.]|nr:hypothetical protein [Rhodobacter sp.]
MTDPTEVPAGEREVVRVYALDLEPAAAAAYKAPPEGDAADWPLRQALGATALDPSQVELFAAADLKGVGLPGYLIDGLGIAAPDIDPDRAALEAETGHIVVVLSAAFQGTAQTLTPTPPLRPLGTYRMAEAERPRAPMPVPGDEAPEMTPGAAPAPGPPPRGTSLIVLLGILLGAVALLALVFYFRSQPY